MKQKMPLKDLWNAVRSRDVHYQTSRDRVRADADPAPILSPRFFVTLTDQDGVKHQGEIVKAVAATETVTIDRHHKRRLDAAERFYQRTSRLVPDAFKVQTVGGTVTINLRGNGSVHVSDHNGARLRVHDLRLGTHPRVDVAVDGPITLERVDNQTLGHLARMAAVENDDVRSMLEELLEKQRNLL